MYKEINIYLIYLKNRLFFYFYLKRNAKKAFNYLQKRPFLSKKYSRFVLLKALNYMSIILNNKNNNGDIIRKIVQNLKSNKYRGNRNKQIKTNQLRVK